MLRVIAIVVLLFVCSFAMKGTESIASSESNEGDLDGPNTVHPRSIVKRQVSCGTNRNCPHWVNNGFCRSNFYTTAQKAHYCGKECRLC